MSYILDALRRADSERERGSVPSIRAQPVPPVSAGAAAKAQAPRPARWIIGGLVLALAGSVVWHFAPGGDEPPREIPAAARDIAVAPSPSPAAVAAISAAPPAAPLPPPAAPTTAVPPRVLEPIAPARKAGAQAPSARAQPRTEAPTGDADAGARIHSLQELPDEVRRTLPALSIGGSIYSEHPANRFLIVNGQTFREKDKIAPDLVLEQIGLKAAVLTHKSYRYRINY